MPLEKQIVNTLRENFLWTENTDTLFISNGGLYRINFGLFSHTNPPEASLIINGVCHFTSSADSGGRNGSRLKKKIKDKGDVMRPLVHRICHSGYYLLANESKISVLCLSENVHEGFLDIKRI
jgi:hypothetical protein